METDRSRFVAYAYTVKTLGTNLDGDYTPFFNKLTKFGIKVEYKIFERDSKGKSHVHGILYLQKGFYRKRICSKGMHIKLKELTNREGWIKYIHKDVKWEDYDDADEKIEMPTKRLF